ncbi:MAG: DUF3040 domain-containing protein [Streptomyces sp.]|nr:DUF3040 domain-containing protein [Streptomyces sp.]NUR42124.1 DUF3040 domain-containing protein [Streptomyces sp.]NUR64711.1 DUF3040 domain-containing protein [Streptomyces sp.]NUS25986.1 DUF3040 domain-containing protein [Streptomyces sp.]NUS80207.1 DUF3040 domain-containing protein [Streptomyces sp.]
MPIVNDRSDPDDVVLSPHERLTLRRIEAELSGDRRLTRRMRRLLHQPADRLHHRPGRPVPRRALPLSTAALLSASMFLVVMGVRTSDPVLLWCFAALWPLTLLQAFRLLCRVTEAGPEARTRSGEHGTPWR